MKIDAKVVGIKDGTTLIRPRRNILTGLTGAKLILNNVVLKNPAEGALFSNRSEVAFRNIKINMKCDCENTQCLKCTQDDFKCHKLQNFVCTEELGVCEDLLAKLITGTSCQVSIF